MHYIGIDIIEIARIKAAIDRWGKHFLQRVYTEPELRQYGKKPSSLAARFAAKEAVIKALGTAASGISWKDIEILSEPGGKPLVRLHGKARGKADALGLGEMAISLSDSREHAIAFVIGATK